MGCTIHLVLRSDALPVEFLYKASAVLFPEEATTHRCGIHLHVGIYLEPQQILKEKKRPVLTDDPQPGNQWFSFRDITSTNGYLSLTTQITMVTITIILRSNCFHSQHFPKSYHVGCVIHVVLRSDALTVWFLYKAPGPHLNIKTVLSTYDDFHVKDKTAVRTSYL